METSTLTLMIRFADGSPFFAGIVLSILSVVAGMFCGRWIIRRVLLITNVVGVILVVISATPQPLWMYAAWLVALAVVMVAGNRTAGILGAIRKPMIVLFMLFSLIFILVEMPHRFMPRIPIPKDCPIYVVGDSVSAGIGTSEKTWPEVMSGISGRSVVNLAQAGAVITAAERQVQRIKETNALVLIEIGGNDMLLFKMDSRKFYSQLDHLLAGLQGKHRLAMFELPLFPFANGIGAAQRELADKYHVTLIPKKAMTTVFATSGATLDELHLSQKGHDMMARTVLGMMEPK
ncbi:MAG: GDSL-type esterase/lipase family protein [bacterium]